MTPTKKEPDRSIRWQKTAVDQLSYTLNLLFTLTIAALGYIFALLRDKDFVPGSSAKGSLLLSLVVLMFAALCGFTCILNRLRDFRGTAQRAKGSEDPPSRDELRGVGRVTWALFYTHCISFGLGVAALLVALILTYGGRLA